MRKKVIYNAVFPEQGFKDSGQRDSTGNVGDEEAQTHGFLEVYLIIEDIRENQRDNN